MHNYLLILIAIGLVSCTDKQDIQSDLSQKIHNQLRMNAFKSIDFSRYAGERWTRICFFGPYSQITEDVIGLSSYENLYADELASDSHNIILFMTDTTIVEHLALNRRYGDFWKLSRQCFNREDARFVLN